MITKRISFFNILRLLGIALFVIILTRIDLGQMTEQLSEIIPALFLYGVVFQIMVLVIKAIRWHVMNDGRWQQQYWVQSFGRFFESYAVGVITPGRLGELLKAGHEKNKEDRASTFVRVVSERGFDISIFILVAIPALFFGEVIEINSTLKWLFLALGLGLAVLSYLLLSSRKVISLLQKLLHRIPLRFTHVQLVVKQYGRGMVAIILLLSVVSSLSYFVSCYFLAQSVSIDISFIDVSAGIAIAGLINMLPVTIMGLGTRELVFLSIFSAVPQASVLAFSITILLVAQIGGGLLALVLGHIFLLIDKKNKR